MQSISIPKLYNMKLKKKKFVSVFKRKKSIDNRQIKKKIQYFYPELLNLKSFQQSVTKYIGT